MKETRLQHIRRARGASNKLVRASLIPSALYGASVVGASKIMIQGLRRSTAAAEPGSTAGRSTELLLLNTSSSPAVPGNTAPIAEWASQ